MRKKVKRVVASTMAALMMLSLAPVSAFNGTFVNNVIAAGLSYEGLDLSGGMKTGESYFNSLGLQTLTTVAYKEVATTIESVSYTGCLDLKTNSDVDGTSKKIPKQGAYKIQPTKSGDMSIAFKLNGGRTFYLVKEDGTEVASVANTTGSSAYFYKTFSLEAGETYYMYSGKNKLFLYGVEWNCKVEAAEYVQMENKASGQVDETSNGKLTYLGAFAVGNDAGNANVDTSSYVFDDAGNNMIKASAKHKTTEIFESETSNKLKDNVNITKGALKFEAEENGTLILDAKLNKNSTTDNKPYFVISVSPSGQTTLVDYRTVTASYYGTFEIETKAGYTYYIGMANNSLTIFRISTIKGTIYDTTPWDEVEAPKITAVNPTSDGFQVTVEGKINKYTAAENIVVTMLHNDGQVAETNITKLNGSTTIDFTAYDNGDYTFVATAQRLGNPDKSSEPKEVKDYVLGVKLPKITWAENKGNGKVYLDWVNISGAKDYTLTYN